MKNQAFIKLLGEDDTKYVDLNEFGVTLIRGWREALLTPAPVKSYVSNDSRLEHGISMVATADCAKVNQREIDLPMFLEGETEDDYLDKLEKTTLREKLKKAKTAVSTQEVSSHKRGLER